MIVSGYAYKDNNAVMDVDDDDFEEKYVITGPSNPAKIKSGHPDAMETKDLLKQKAVEFVNCHQRHTNNQDDILSLQCEQ